MNKITFECIHAFEGYIFNSCNHVMMTYNNVRYVTTYEYWINSIDFLYYVVHVILFHEWLIKSDKHLSHIAMINERFQQVRSLKEGFHHQLN